MYKQNFTKFIDEIQKDTNMKCNKIPFKCNKNLSEIR